MKVTALVLILVVFHVPTVLAGQPVIVNVKPVKLPEFHNPVNAREQFLAILGSGTAIEQLLNCNH